MSGGGGWDALSASAKAERIARMLESRARGRAKRAAEGQASTRPPKAHQVVEVETISVPAPDRGSAPADSLEALASLIVAVWRKL